MGLVNSIFGGFLNSRFVSNQLVPCESPGWRGVQQYQQIRREFVDELFDMDRVKAMPFDVVNQTFLTRQIRRCINAADTAAVSADGLMPLPATSAGTNPACAAARPAVNSSMPCIGLAYNTQFVNNTGAKNGGALSVAFAEPMRKPRSTKYHLT